MGEDGNVAKIRLLIPACHHLARYYRLSPSRDYVICIYNAGSLAASMKLFLPRPSISRGTHPTNCYCFPIKSIDERKVNALRMARRFPIAFIFHIDRHLAPSRILIVDFDTAASI